MITKILLKVSALFGIMSVSPFTWAGCNVSGGTYSYSATLPTQTFNIPKNKATGPIGSVMPIGAGVSRTISCSGGATYTHLKFGTALTPSSFSGIYKTNVEGIGIKVWDDFLGTVIVDNDIKRWYQVSGGSSYSGGAWLTNIKAQYYIIGPVSAGTVTPNIIVEAWANTATTTSGGARYNMLTMTGSAVIQAAACETPDISVDMKKHASADFPSVGSTSAATPFNFTINNCDAGMTSVSYTFKPAAGVTLNGSGAGQYISLKSGSTASGVGVQVQYENGTNVPFNTKTKFTGYSGAGNYTIPMRARYIRTGIVKGGTANSAVEFEMAYE